MKDYGPKPRDARFLTSMEVEQILAENEHLRRENSRLEGEVRKWVTLTLGGIAAREKSMWDLMMSGLLDDKKLEEVRGKQESSL